jgi:putative two-component system response regulator
MSSNESARGLKLMSSQLKPTTAAASAAVPAHWEENPLVQLRGLRDEVTRQRDVPGARTRGFMSAAHDAIKRLPDDFLPAERAEVLIDVATYHHIDAQVELATLAAAAAVRAASLGRHRALEARARMLNGVILGETYDFPAALSEFAQALEIARTDGDTLREARVLNNLAGSLSDAGQCEEALAIFERLAKHWEETDDRIALGLALSNAALAALRLGEMRRGIEIVERWQSAPHGEMLTTHERLWFAQGALTYCQLMIHADRAEEALNCARKARSLAQDPGLAQAETLAVIGEAISAFSTGATGSAGIESAIARARAESPNAYWCALDAAIRTYDRAGLTDKALELQRELLAFSTQQKFDKVRGALGRPSPEESGGVATLTQLGKVVDRTITELVNLAITQSLRSGYDHGRIFRVGRLAELFTRAEGWPAERTQLIALAGKLIDVGTMVISDHLLSKQQRLSEEEKQIVNEHAKFGADVLVGARLTMLEPIVPIVRLHHERWDGTGPRGLQGEQIPIEARVVALCDVFDALTHERPWRPAMTLPTALRVIRENAGLQFDPDLSDHFVAWVQGEFWRVDDFELHIACEATENGYVKMRERIHRLSRTPR